MTNEPDPGVDDLARTVIGSAIEVHRHLGPSFSERVYDLALCAELGLRQIALEQQVPVSLAYKGTVISEGRVDLFVSGAVALLINFNMPLLRQGIRRVIAS